MTNKLIYRITFVNQSKVYELFAQYVDQAEIFGFIEVGDFIFGENTSVVVDPAEEKLKTEFADVKKTLIPLQAVVRIDEVAKEGVAKIHNLGEKGSNVMPFPMSTFMPNKSPEKTDP